MGDIMAYVHLRVILKNKIDNYKYCSGRIGKILLMDQHKEQHQ